MAASTAPRERSAAISVTVGFITVARATSLVHVSPSAFIVTREMLAASGLVRANFTSSRCKSATLWMFFGLPARTAMTGCWRTSGSTSRTSSNFRASASEPSSAAMKRSPCLATRKLLRSAPVGPYCNCTSTPTSARYFAAMASTGCFSPAAQYTVSAVCPRTGVLPR